MPDIRALRSYLVSLGFSVNTSQAAQFNNAIQTAAQVVNTNTANIVTNMAKWGGAVIAMFEGVGVATISMMDKAATADQQYRLLGQTMFMDAQHAKTMKVAMDALGLSLNQIAFDPEANARFAALEKFQDQFPNFEASMIHVRDAQMEMAKFRIEALYFRDFLTRDIFNALGGEQLTDKLRSWNDYISSHMPEWSRIISTYIVPVLKYAWEIMTDLWQVAKDFAQIFTNIVGLFSLDSSVMGTVNLEKFAHSLQKVAHLLAVVIGLLTHFAGTIAGAGLGFMIGGPMGALIGAGIGAGTDAARSLFQSESPGQGATNTAGAGLSAGSSVGIGQTNDVRSLAAQVGGNLGVDPSTIYAQWAHETGNFGNRGARELNNLAGIRMPGSTEYRAFGSLSDFGDYYTGLIQRKYPGAVGAQSIDQYATALKSGGYFEDSLKNYERGMHSFEGAYGGGGRSIQIGAININNPNASPEQIKDAIADGIQQHENQITSANLAELRAMY